MYSWRSVLLALLLSVEALSAGAQQARYGLGRAPTPEEWTRLSHEVQRYVIGNMVQMSATTLPFIQAARDQVKGYVFERGFKIRFETTWLEKP